ncbi:hypothetical protein BH10PSE11_BH10PSE11_10340 [soil metagenome]
MGQFGFRLGLAALAGAVIALWGTTSPGMAQTANSRIDEALQNITTLVRPGRVGYATFWDGNKYIQCRRMTDRSLRCEAAGTSMQRSLKSVLTSDRLTRLAALGWVLDPSFGNHVQIFPADLPTERAAHQIMQALTDGYSANMQDLEIQTAWIIDTPCPPRNGPSQNLAGIVNDAPSMRSTAVRACSYTPPAATPQIASSAAELVGIYGASTTAEIQRLRINATRQIYTVFDAGIGYIQCAPETPPVAIYCEAQSAESWAALTTVLTPERVARLRNAGYADPGRAPNYSKSYPLDKYKDADIASEILTLLHESYGYTGTTKLKTTTE